MSKCCNDTLLKAIGIKKLDKHSKLTFNILYSFPDCRLINTRDYVSIGEGNTTTYDALDRPDDALECNHNHCVNTGTRTVAKGTAQNAEITFKAAYDMTDLATGIMTFYAKTTNNVTVLISSTSDFEDADSYTVSSGNGTSDDFYLFTVDLSETPTSVVGDGWEPSQSGAFIKVTAGTSDSTLDISSIFFFENMEELELNHVVEMSCLTGFEGEDTVDAIESACFAGSYDESSVDGGLERTITGTAITSNWWMLNPLMQKGTTTTSYMSCNSEMTIVADNSTNPTAGIVRLLDAYEDECGYISVQLVKPCSVAEATLKRIDVATSEAVDAQHFYVSRSESGETSLVFNPDLIGETVRISYPREIRGEVININKLNLANAPRVRMTREIPLTDGDIYIVQYDNVLITSFSDNQTSDGNAEISIGINIQPNEDDGNFGRIIRVTK